MERRRLGGYLGIFVLGLVLFIAGKQLPEAWRTVSSSPSDGQQDLTRRLADGQDLREIQLVLLVSESCGFCASDELPDIIQAAKTKMADLAADEGMAFAAVAVGIDRTVEGGLRDVGRFGNFDQIVVGGNWFNLGASEYVWSTHAGPAQVPQVILLERHFGIDGDRLTRHENLLMRVVGLEELKRWRKAGFPVPTIPASG